MLLRFIFCVSFLTYRINAEDAAGAPAYNKEKFDSTVESKPHFIKFYAPWCGHCQRLAPVWDELAKKIDPAVVVIAKVDCTEETALCSEQGVTGYPTLKLFNGKKTESTKYKGPRDLDSIFKWVLDELQVEKAEEHAEVPNVEQAELLPKEEKAIKEGNVYMLTSDSYEQHVQTGSHFVKFYAPWCPHCKNMIGIWDDLAAVYNTEGSSVTIAKVDCTAHRDVCTANEVRGYPSLVWITNGRSVDKYDGGRDLESLQIYVEKMKGSKEDMGTDEEKVPTGTQKVQEAQEEKMEEDVAVLGTDNFDSVIMSGITFVKFYAPWCGHCKRLVPVWAELGKKFKTSSNVKIAKVDCTEYRDLCGQHQVRGFPTLVLFKNGDRIAEYTGKRDVEALSGFIMDKVPHDEL